MMRISHPIVMSLLSAAALAGRMAHAGRREEIELGINPFVEINPGNPKPSYTRPVSERRWAEPRVNRYEPHQGSREMARRRKQMAKAAA